MHRGTLHAVEQRKEATLGPGMPSSDSRSSAHTRRNCPRRCSPCRSASFLKRKWRLQPAKNKTGLSVCAPYKQHMLLPIPTQGGGRAAPAHSPHERAERSNGALYTRRSGWHRGLGSPKGAVERMLWSRVICTGPRHPLSYNRCKRWSFVNQKPDRSYVTWALFAWKVTLCSVCGPP